MKDLFGVPLQKLKRNNNLQKNLDISNQVIFHQIKFQEFFVD